MPNFKIKVIVAVFVAFLLPVAGHADSNNTRAEKILMQLSVGNGSAGFHIFEAKRESREMHKNLRKALYKVREADKVYAKSVGKPDSRFLAAATTRLATLKEKTEALENEIMDAFKELKDSVKQTLVVNAMQK